MSTWQLLILTHILGVALALGAAVVKVALLLALRADGDLTHFLRVSRPITRLIVTGMILLTASGVGFVALGRPFTTMLVVKIALALGVWGVGPVIDKVLEPRLREAVASGPSGSAALRQIRPRYVAIEVAATLLLVSVTVLGVLV